MARFDLRDAECALIELVLPTEVRGRERVRTGACLEASSDGCVQVHLGPASRRAPGPTRPEATASGDSASGKSGIGFRGR